MDEPITDLDSYPKKLLTLEAYADYLQVSTHTLYRHIDKGSLFAVKVGGLLRIPIEEARRFASIPAR